MRPLQRYNGVIPSFVAKEFMLHISSKRAQNNCRYIMRKCNQWDAQGGSICEFIFCYSIRSQLSVTDCFADVRVGNGNGLFGFRPRRRSGNRRINCGRIRGWSHVRERVDPDFRSTAGSDVVSSGVRKGEGLFERWQGSIQSCQIQSLDHLTGIEEELPNLDGVSYCCGNLHRVLFMEPLGAHPPNVRLPALLVLSRDSFVYHHIYDSRRHRNHYPPKSRTLWFTREKGNACFFELSQTGVIINCFGRIAKPSLDHCMSTSIDRSTSGARCFKRLSTAQHILEERKCKINVAYDCG